MDIEVLSSETKRRARRKVDLARLSATLKTKFRACSADFIRSHLASRRTSIQVFACELCLSPTELVSVAESRLSRDLTPAERERFRL